MAAPQLGLRDGLAFVTSVLYHQRRANNLTSFNPYPPPGFLDEIDYPLDTNLQPVSPENLSRYSATHQFNLPYCFHGRQTKVTLNAQVGHSPTAAITCAEKHIALQCPFFIDVGHLIASNMINRYRKYDVCSPSPSMPSLQNITSVNHSDTSDSSYDELDDDSDASSDNSDRMETSDVAPAETAVPSLGTQAISNIVHDANLNETSVESQPVPNFAGNDIAIGSAFNDTQITNANPNKPQVESHILNNVTSSGLRVRIPASRSLHHPAPFAVWEDKRPRSFDWCNPGRSPLHTPINFGHAD